MQNRLHSGSASTGVFTIQYKCGQNDLELLSNVAKSIAALLGLTTRRIDVERYQPQGFTIILYLEESHILLEAYPEDELIEFHIGSCKVLDEEDVLFAIEKYIGPVKGRYFWGSKQFFGWGCGHI